MITIRENTDRRLFLTDARHVGYGTMLAILLFGEFVALGAVSILGVFGALLSAFWTGFLVFFISQYNWVSAVFDADAQFAETLRRET